MRTNVRCRRVLALGGAVVLACGLSPTAHAVAGDPAPATAIIELDGLPGHYDSAAAAINDDGVIVGRSGGHAVRWDLTGRVTDLGTLPGGRYSHAVDVNNRGTIVGQATSSDGGYHLVLWDREGRITDLGTLPGGTFFTPLVINDEDSVLGYGNAEDGLEHAVRWDRDRRVELLAAGDVAGEVVALNNRGVTLGRDPVFAWGSVLWDRDGRTTRLPVYEPFRQTEGLDLNDDGTTVGVSYLGLVKGIPLRWDHHGNLTVLQTPYEEGIAYAVNSYGTAVGAFARDFFAYDHACSWDRDGVMTSLGTAPGFLSSAAVDVSDNGTIVGHAGRRDADGSVSHAIRWDPDGELTDLGTLGGRSSFVVDVNTAGVTIGGANTTSGETRAVLWPAPRR